MAAIALPVANTCQNKVRLMTLNQIGYVDSSALIVDSAGLSYINPEAAVYHDALPSVDMQIKKTSGGVNQVSTITVKAGIKQWFVPTVAQVSGVDFTAYYNVDGFI